MVCETGFCLFFYFGGRAPLEHPNEITTMHKSKLSTLHNGDFWHCPKEKVFFLARLSYSLAMHEADKMPDTALSVQVTTTLSLIPEKPSPATQLVSLDNNLESAGVESRLTGKEE